MMTKTQFRKKVEIARQNGFAVMNKRTLLEYDIQCKKYSAITYDLYGSRCIDSNCNAYKLEYIFV